MGQAEALKAVVGGVVEPPATISVTLGCKGSESEGALYQRKGVAVGKTVSGIRALFDVDVAKKSHSSYTSLVKNLYGFGLENCSTKPSLWQCCFYLKKDSVKKNFNRNAFSATKL